MPKGFYRDGGIHQRAWDIFARTSLKADERGWVNTSVLRVHFEPPRSAFDLVNGNDTTSVTSDEIEIVGSWLEQFESFDDGRLRSLVLADNGWSVVRWRTADSACVFASLRREHVRVLRALAGTGLSSDERREAEISGRETVLQLSALYGCQGRHDRECPRPGPWPHSLVGPDGAVVAAKVALL